jgi:CHAD domain-containing protein
MQEPKNEQNDKRQADAPQPENTSWAELETKALASVAERMKSALLRLNKKSSRGRIHDARTALKRWNAVWSVLAADGWTFDADASDELKKLFKKLGDVRDYDVYLKKAEELDVPENLIEHWKSRRKKARKQLESKLKNSGLRQVCSLLDKAMKHKPPVIAHLASESPNQQHIDFVLQEQEKRVEKAAIAPATPEDYHSVRKELKNLDYLLEELRHVKIEQLLELEKTLGDLHDLDKLAPLLLGNERNQAAVLNLQTEREHLISDLQNLKDKLQLGYQSSQHSKTA